MILTDEYVAECRCMAFVRAAESLASALREIGTPEAKQHAKEALGAGKIARQWARELSKEHRRKEREHKRVEATRRASKEQ
jgi:hypothetical protein